MANFVHVSLLFALGILGSFLSLMVFLAPLPTIWKFYKKKSTEGFQPIQYVVALYSAILWLYYAILERIMLLRILNSIGCLIQPIYIIVYVIYAPKAAKIFTGKLMILLTAGVLGFVLLSTLLFKRAALGWVCASFSVLVFASPLYTMWMVIKTRSVEFMQLSISIFLTLSAAVWLPYGLLKRDFFLALPNVLGLTFGIIQIGFYIFYKGTKVSRLEQNLPVQALDDSTSTLEGECVNV